jgi:hypothetical protein
MSALAATSGPFSSRTLGVDKHTECEDGAQVPPLSIFLGRRNPAGQKPYGENAVTELISQKDHEARPDVAGLLKFTLRRRRRITPFNLTKIITAAMRKMVALLFLIAIALVPFLIVVMYSREGGIWVLGYVTGIITVPVVGIAAIRAINILSDEGAFIGTVVFGFVVILISLATALRSLFW